MENPGEVHTTNLYIVLYRIIGEKASHRTGEFASAVFFAHEYGILATSLQDRPFIPKSFVAIGGIPESCQCLFRKWSDNGEEDVGRRPKVVPLNDAIEAIRE